MANEIMVYTDGGARGNGKEDCVSAWAYTLSYGEHYKENKGAMYGATNNQMEMTAIIEALKAIKIRPFLSSYIVILPIVLLVLLHGFITGRKKVGLTQRRNLWRIRNFGLKWTS